MTRIVVRQKTGDVPSGPINVCNFWTSCITENYGKNHQQKHTIKTKMNKKFKLPFAAKIIIDVNILIFFNKCEINIVMQYF
jgi:hypothetical protein